MKVATSDSDSNTMDPIKEDNEQNCNDNDDYTESKIIQSQLMKRAVTNDSSNGQSKMGSTKAKTNTKPLYSNVKINSESTKKSTA